MSDHDWCSDVRRDEAVRAAEDAAAVPSIMHRDLPEQVALLWASLGDLLGRVVRLEGEMDAGQDEEAAPAVCDSVPPADGLRTERVTAPWQRAKWDEALAIICDGGDWGRGNNLDHGVLGALVIWADKEMDRLTAERDAARARVAELEAAAANAGVEEQEPVGYGVRTEWGQFRAGLYTSQRAPANLERGDEVVPLYAAPQPPRGWLTEEDREALYLACAVLHGVFVGSWREKHEAAKRLEAIRVRAIREAGGEVEG